MIDEMKRQKRELVYKGSILDIYKDTMQFANGKTEEWDFVSHRKGAAAVLPVLDDGRIIMVRQKCSREGDNRDSGRLQRLCGRRYQTVCRKGA